MEEKKFNLFDMIIQLVSPHFRYYDEVLYCECMFCGSKAEAGDKELDDARELVKHSSNCPLSTIEMVVDKIRGFFKRK